MALLFSFNKILKTDPSLKTIQKEFKRYGSEVVQIDVASTVKKMSGIEYREISMTFADSQVVTLRVKSSGDIFQVLINGKVKPIAAQDDHTAAIKEIVNAVQAGAAAFQKKLASKKIEVPDSKTDSKMTSGVNNLEEQLKERIEALKQEIAVVDETISSQEKELAAIDSDGDEGGDAFAGQKESKPLETLIGKSVDIFHDGKQQVITVTGVDRSLSAQSHINFNVRSRTPNGAVSEIGNGGDDSPLAHIYEIVYGGANIKGEKVIEVAGRRFAYMASKGANAGAVGAAVKELLSNLE